jgi:membrane protein implicated in regulation of membrane protease activity
MPWWGWISIGALMLAAEMAFVDAEFYLVFLGVSALLVGGVDLAGTTLPYWAQWLLFAGLALGSLVFFRHRVYGAMHPPPDGAIQEGVTGDVAIAREPIAPDATGSVDLRGARWTAHNEGERTIETGGRCIVSRSEGLTLHVKAAD